jgi:hypothetical protein
MKARRKSQEVPVLDLGVEYCCVHEQLLYATLVLASIDLATGAPKALDALPGSEEAFFGYSALLSVVLAHFS